LISCLCEGLTSNLSSIPPHSALAVQRICINGLSIGLSEVPESMTQRISAIVGDMHKVCERNLGPKRHLQVWPPFLFECAPLRLIPNTLIIVILILIIAHYLLQYYCLLFFLIIVLFSADA
jgi:hypothetical protein